MLLLPSGEQHVERHREKRDDRVRQGRRRSLSQGKRGSKRNHVRERD